MITISKLQWKKKVYAIKYNFFVNSFKKRLIKK